MGIWTRQFGSAITFCAGITLLSAAPPQTVGDPVDHLSHASVFAFGGVGFAGVISKGEKDYLVILSRPSAEVDFEKVLANGTPEAKAYALSGIHKLDPVRFKALSETVRTATTQVHTARGCILGNEALGTLIQGIEKRGYSQ